MSQELISVQNLSVSFSVGKQKIAAVRDVSFSLSNSEILGIVGESGSGKSVSVHSLLQLNDSNSTTSGKIFVDGKDVSLLSKKELLELRRNFFGVIFQEPSLAFDPLFTIEGNFYELFRSVDKSITKKESAAKAIKLLEEVKISSPEKRIKNYPHQFSGGMLQRIMIALALANNPKVLIADEPTTALDVTIQHQIIELLVSLQRKRGMSIIFISHNLPLVKMVANKIIVLYGGLVLEQNESDSLVKNPLSPYTAGLLSSMPKINSHYTTSKLSAIEGNVYDPSEKLSGCPFAPRCNFKSEKCAANLPELKNIDNALVRCFYPLQKNEAQSGK